MTVRIIKKNEKFIPQYRLSKAKNWVEFSKGDKVYEFESRSDALGFVVEQSINNENES